MPTDSGGDARDAAADLTPMPSLAIPPFVVVTFNAGTTPGLPHDAPPDDGYGAAEAERSDQYYGDGLAWRPFIEDARRAFAGLDADLVAFQEVFWTGECHAVPAEARPGFICEDWEPGDPTVAQVVLGGGWQVACHPGHPDKCLAVRRRFGRFAGCVGAQCPDALVGEAVAGCGRGARVARGVVEHVSGERLTIVSVHGTSGLTTDDVACRTAQVEHVFVDLGDGAPGANGDANLVLGDLNTDPLRLADGEASARRWRDFAGPGRPFAFLSDRGQGAPPSYGGFVDIDHVLADRLAGSCRVLGLSEGTAPVSEAVYFDHRPVVCAVEAR